MPADDFDDAPPFEPQPQPSVAERIAQEIEALPVHNGAGIDHLGKTLRAQAAEIARKYA